MALSSNSTAECKAQKIALASINAYCLGSIDRLNTHLLSINPFQKEEQKGLIYLITYIFKLIIWKWNSKEIALLNSQVEELKCLQKQCCQASLELNQKIEELKRAKELNVTPAQVRESWEDWLKSWGDWFKSFVVDVNSFETSKEDGSNSSERFTFKKSEHKKILKSVFLYLAKTKKNEVVEKKLDSFVDIFFSLEKIKTIAIEGEKIIIDYPENFDKVIYHKFFMPVHFCLPKHVVFKQIEKQVCASSQWPVIEFSGGLPSIRYAGFTSKIRSLTVDRDNIFVELENGSFQYFHNSVISKYL
ncbi:MAG: hypothetical protein COT84_03230 [Chlamydiae bacterium CG10_big_fil_rev_8_21_14_0_10_35_9]|nr:MAG: hypothetical protein COT84_03230 [Chlamydiae bacterium CG10_big_fil_rev_8_21_14_0_10_35_9]